MVLALIVAASCLNYADTPLDLATLGKIVDGLQADLKDVEFLFEGGVRNVEKHGPNGAFEKTFQGNFAYRSDGSAAIDLYTRSADSSVPLRRQITCLSDRSKLQELDFRPDFGTKAVQIKTSHAGIPALEAPGSPLRFIEMPTLLEYLRDSGGYRTDNRMNYECVGWDEVDKHKCLKIRFFSETLFHDQPIIQKYYWVDLERSGNVLKFEYYYQGNLWISVNEVDLASYPVGANKAFWYPNHGVVRSFVTGKRVRQKEFETLKEPVFEEVFTIVNTVPRWNQGLPDERFKVDYVKSATSSLQAARSEVEANLRRTATQPPRAVVTNVIAEADRQKLALEASAPSREWFSTTMLGSLSLGAFGAVLISSAVLARRRA